MEEGEGGGQYIKSPLTTFDVQNNLLKSSHISTTDGQFLIDMYLKITNWGGEGEVGVNIYSHHSLLLIYKTTY